MQHLKVFAATLAIFLVLDALWLVLVANAFFKSEVGPLLRAQPDLIVAALFYPIYAGGLTILAVTPSLRERSAGVAAWRGAVLGLTAYATFDLTNLAILEGWTRAVAVFDMTWGTAVSAVSALVGHHIARRFLGIQSSPQAEQAQAAL